jgi:hypothetical protein
MLESLSDLLNSETLVAFVQSSNWVWPVCEIVHFFGMSLLIGTVGLLDLRMLGVAKSLPIGPLQRLIPWGLFGFGLNLVTATIMVGGIAANPGLTPLWALQNLAFELKMLCLFLAGLNLLVFYASGIARAADALGPGESAPLGAKVIAATSLVLWIGVIYFGRMIMYEDELYLADEVWHGVSRLPLSA